MRVPTAWRANRPPRPQVTGTVGGKAPSGLGKDALLDFKMGVTLDGEPLTEAEIEKLLAASNGLHLVRGRWVEVDREKLSRMLDEFRAVEAAAAKGGCLSAKRCALVAGAHVPGDTVVDGAPEWSHVVAGPWLSKTLAGLRDPSQIAQHENVPTSAIGEVRGLIYSVRSAAIGSIRDAQGRISTDTSP